MVVLSVSRATADWTEYSLQNKTHFAYRFLVVREWLYEFAKQEAHRRRQKTDIRIVQSERVSRRQQVRSFLRTIFSYRPIISLGRTIFPYRPIKSFLRTIFPYRPIRSLGRTIFRIGHSDRSDGPSFFYRPIRSLGASPAEITKRSSHSHGHGPHGLTRARSPSL